MTQHDHNASGQQPYQPPQQGQPGYPPPQGYQQGPPPPGYQQGPPPGHYQGPPQQGWQQPQPAPKKSHKGRNILLGVIGVIVLIVIISAVAGGGSKNNDSKSSGGKSSSTNTGVSTGLGSKDASRDIKLGKIDASSGFGIEVPVTATNSSSKRSDYSIDLSLESADGKTQYDTAVAFLQNVEPGQSATDKGIFLKESKLPAGARVVVKEVQRLASS